MKKLLLPFIFFFLFSQTMTGQEDPQRFLLLSPDKTFGVNILLGKDIRFAIEDREETLVFIRAGLAGLEGPFNGKKMKWKNSQGMDDLRPIVPHKRSHIQSAFQQYRFSFPKQEMHLTVRMYNSGMAYRFESEREGEWLVEDEILDLNFPKDTRTFFPKEDTLTSHFERYYIEDEAVR
ncbi:MAG: glycoside hydrolase family 97 N-terminal domain-containing protein, partial [Bacteroidota bacterium]